MTRALDRQCQTALVLGTGARLTAWTDLPAIGQVAAQQIAIRVGDFLDLVHAEAAELGTARAPSAPAAPPTTTLKIVVVQFHISHVFILLVREGHRRHSSSFVLGVSKGVVVGLFVGVFLDKVRSTTIAQNNHLVGNQFGAIMAFALFVFPAPGLQSSLNIDLLVLLEM